MPLPIGVTSFPDRGNFLLRVSLVVEEAIDMSLLRSEVAAPPSDQGNRIVRVCLSI